MKTIYKGINLKVSDYNRETLRFSGTEDFPENPEFFVLKSAILAIADIIKPEHDAIEIIKSCYAHDFEQNDKEHGEMKKLITGMNRYLVEIKGKLSDIFGRLKKSYSENNRSSKESRCLKVR